MQFHDFQAYQRLDAMQVEIDTLKIGIKGSSNDMNDRTNELTDLKLAASEARNDTKIVRLESKIDLLSLSVSNLGTKIDAQRSEVAASRNLIFGTIVAASLSISALLYALFSYGASTFYNGTVVRDIVHAEVNSVKNATTSAGAPSAH